MKAGLIWERLYSSGFSTFTLIGGIGFIVDASVLTLLFHYAGFGHFSARAVSFSLAVTITWYLNRKLTFNRHISQRWQGELSRYFIVQSIGALINLAVYTPCVLVNEDLAKYPIIALGIGAVAGLIFNYFGARWLVFTQQR